MTFKTFTLIHRQNDIFYNYKDKFYIEINQKKHSPELLKSFDTLIDISKSPQLLIHEYIIKIVLPENTLF